MKKKTKKRMFQTLAITALSLQVAELGVGLWKQLKQSKKNSFQSYANGKLDHAKEDKIIVPA